MTAHSSRTSPSQSLDAFESLLARSAALGDDALADVIASASPPMPSLTLAPFLRAIPDLGQRPVVLDGAIDACLRARGDRALDSVAAELRADHPEFTQEIDLALRLEREMIGTTELAEWIANPDPLTLPMEVGPELDRGRRRYLLQELLGIGAQGCVYLALDLALSSAGHKTWVAVKRLHHPGSRDEAAKARRISHQHVVRPLDAFEDEQGASFSVFEHVPGPTLEAVRQAEPGRFDSRRAAELIIKLASGVQAAHAAGVVHRDLKPSNILMLGAEPKITDFGIAHRLRIGEDRRGNGSLAFVSPQQFQGEPPSPQDDVYSLAAILFWLLTGMYANGSSAPVAGERLSGATPAPPRLRSLRPDLDVDLESICDRGLAFNPQSRYRSADALIADLHAWLGRRPLDWARTPLRRRLSLSFQRHRALWIGGFLAAGFTGLSAAFVVQRIADAEARRLTAELHALNLEHDALKDRDIRARAVGTMFQNTLIQSRPDSAPANWIHAATFLEAFGGAELFGDVTKNQVLWDKRIDFAQLVLQDADKAGRRDTLEPLLIETCLVVWLVRAERGEDALAHIDRISPIWRRLLLPEDPWLSELEVYRAGAAFFAVKPDQENAKAVRAQRLAEAEAAAARVDPLPKPLVLMMQHLRSLKAR